MKVLFHLLFLHVQALGPDYGLKMACKWDETTGSTVESYKLEGGAAGGKAASQAPAQEEQKQKQVGGASCHPVQPTAWPQGMFPFLSLGI